MPSTFTGWLVLYLVQTVLASTGNVRLHRRLGGVAIFLAVVMMIVGYRTTIEMVRRGFDLSGDLERLGPVILQTPFQLCGLPLFGGLVLIGILNRRRPDVHKRLMWLTIPGTPIGAPLVHAIGHYGLPFVVAPLANLSPLAAIPWTIASPMAGCIRCRCGAACFSWSSRTSSRRSFRRARPGRGSSFGWRVEARADQRRRRSVTQFCRGSSSVRFKSLNTKAIASALKDRRVCESLMQALANR